MSASFCWSLWMGCSAAAGWGHANDFDPVSGYHVLLCLLRCLRRTLYYINHKPLIIANPAYCTKKRLNSGQNGGFSSTDRSLFFFKLPSWRKIWQIKKKRRRRKVLTPLLFLHRRFFSGGLWRLQAADFCGFLFLLLDWVRGSDYPGAGWMGSRW